MSVPQIHIMDVRRCTVEAVQEHLPGMAAHFFTRRISIETDRGLLALTLHADTAERCQVLDENGNRL
jgi:hypothetical protein